MDEILTILIDQWKYDVAVMSQPWMYYWLLVPIMAYVAFFFVKWAVLMAPVWLPFACIVRAWKA